MLLRLSDVKIASITRMNSPAWFTAQAVSAAGCVTTSSALTEKGKQMTDRERLIEILRKPIFPHELADQTEAVADYLLDNGIVIREKGDWHYEEDEYGTYFECTICGCQNQNYDADEGRTDFCPWCGADMRGEQDDT